MISDFTHSGDIEAWQYFEKLLHNHRLAKEYQRHLLETLLTHAFLEIADNDLVTMMKSLANMGLLYEADLFIYWLFFQKGVFVNPIPTVQRSLRHNCVSPSEAGTIIGYGRGMNRKLIYPKISKLVASFPSESEKLINELDSFIIKNPTHSFENKIRSLMRIFPRI